MALAGVRAAERTTGEGPSELLTLDVLIFEFASAPERRRGLRLRIFDEAGTEVGYVVDDHKLTWPGYLLDRRVGVYDRNRTKVIEIVASEPIEVADGAGRTIGSIVARNRARTRFTLKVSWRIAGRIESERAKDPDLAWTAVVRDPTAQETGQIVFPKNRAAANRLLRAEPTVAPGSGWGQRLKGYLTGSFLVRLWSDKLASRISRAE